MKSCTVDIDGIGPVLFEPSRRARHIIISIRSSTVRVAVPVRTSFGRAMDFVYDKKDLVRKNLEKFRQYEKQGGVYRDSVRTIDRASAREKLIARLSCMAEKYGLQYNRVTIREQRTLWGSCSRKNNISLNVKLVLLPDELIDYVMLHELVHTRIHHHGPEFWGELDKYVGNARYMAKRLRMNDLKLQ